MLKDSVYDLSLDVQGRGMQTTVPVKRGDSARCLRLRLTQSGRHYAMEEDCTAVFTARKPDDTVIYNQCTVEQGLALYRLTGQETNSPGAVRCELRLYDAGGKLLTSPAFCLMVEDTVYDDEAVMDSSPEFTALTALVAQAKALLAAGENFADKAALEELAAFVGEPEALNTAAKENLVAAVNELQGLLAQCRRPVEVYGEAPVDGLHYEAAVEGLVVESGLEILLTVASTNQGACDLAINGGEAYPLCYRPGYFTGSNYLRPELRMPLEAEMLLRGAEYVFRFDGYSWILQSFLALPDEGGCEIPAQDEEPEAEDGALWIDTDAEPESAGYVTTEVLAAALETVLEMADETQKAYTDGAIAEALAGIGVAEEGSY